MERVLDVHEVAKYLGLAEMTIYRKIREGELPAVRIGRKWKFPQDLIDNWLREKAGMDNRKAKISDVPEEFGSYKGKVAGSTRRRDIYSAR
ncbi:MAG: helix-turn-helix domain-containing protein [Deltaproteobacteria bacterium]|nr:helix-turn-helix domain-containing protein [Deltaproteobacteria bacterium]